jgi:hypothetical protein
MSFETGLRSPAGHIMTYWRSLHLVRVILDQLFAVKSDFPADERCDAVVATGMSAQNPLSLKMESWTRNTEHFRMPPEKPRVSQCML